MHSDSEGQRRPRLPAPEAKIELHVHIEGSVPARRMLNMWGRNRLVPPASTVEELATVLTSRPGFDGFRQAWDIVTDCLRTGSDLTMATVYCVVEAARHGAVYIEATFSPARHLRLGLTLNEVFRRFCEGAELAERLTGTIVRLTPDISRGVDPDLAVDIARTSVRFASHGVVGLGIGGDERFGTIVDYRHAILVAQDAGLSFVPHAGELVGSSVREALAFGPSRLRHGLLAACDPAALETIVSQQVVLDVCPTSAIRLSPMATGLLRTLVGAGAQCSIGTDDPTIFATNLAKEHLLCQLVGGPTSEQAYAAGVLGALCDDTTRSRLEKPAVETHGAPGGGRVWATRREPPRRVRLTP